MEDGGGGMDLDGAAAAADTDGDDIDDAAADATRVCKNLSSECDGAVTKARERSIAAPMLTQAPIGVKQDWT